MDVFTVPKTAASAPGGQLYPLDRKFEDDPIAILIERTSHPEGASSE